MPFDTGKITSSLVNRLELAADAAFDLVLRDIMNTEDGFDYPVGSLVLDKTGNLELGKAVSTDIRSNNHRAHAEISALDEAMTSVFEPEIVVSTMEACMMCYTDMAHRIGHSGLNAYVVSRTVSEHLGHVFGRTSTTDESVEGIATIQLLDRRLQTKGNVLLQNHTERDPKTKITQIFDRPNLRKKFSAIDKQFPLGMALDTPRIIIKR